MQVSAREAIASYDGQQTAQRLTAATTSALVQVAPTLALTLTLTRTQALALPYHSSFTKADRNRTATAVYLGPKQQAAFWGRNSPGPAAAYSTPSTLGTQAHQG